MSARVLFLDIEISPTLATVWGLFKQTIAISQITGNSEVLTWAAKWHGEREVLDGSLLRDGKRRMLRRMHKLLSEADAVVTWNGNAFDLKVLNKEFLLLGLPEPAPFKSVDLLLTSRRRFRFTSNKLDYVAQQLGLGKKLQHSGHELWLRCMGRDRAAFDEMLDYNRQDVVLLERIYDRFGSWVKGKPNASIEAGHACPHCESERLQRRGWQATKTRRYARWQCMDCKAWSQSVHADPGSARLKEVA